MPWSSTPVRFWQRFDLDDEHHSSYPALLGESSERLVLPAPVLVVELDYWIRKRLSLEV